MKLPAYIQHAIKCGSVPPIRKWETMPVNRLTQGERILRFANDHLVFPEGVSSGKPLHLDLFQQVFILAAFNETGEHISKSILSMARRGGKTLVMAVIMLAYVLGPMARQNTLVRSGAMTRDQAGLLYRLMSLICDMSLDLEGMYRKVPSSKKIIGLAMNVEYQSLSRDAKSGHGQAIYAMVVDECGQIVAPNDDFLDMLFSSMGTWADAKSFLISTQAPSDAAYFSVEIDTAEREQPDNVVCHLYTAKTDDLEDRDNWWQSNPSLRGGYRSIKDIERSSAEAVRVPAKQAGFLNLFLNRRVALESLWLAPAIWKENAADPDISVFQFAGARLGLDLSMRNDLTCAVIAAADDDGNIHLLTYAFTPLGGIEDRSKRDKVPYAQWVKDGIIYAPPGDIISYDWIAAFLRIEFDRLGIEIISIEFDRWRVNDFKAACEREGFAQMAEWTEVGQGYYGISPRVENFESMLLERKIRHGSHPVLNLGASSAIRVMDPAGNSKLDKTKSSQKIDGIIAAIMAVYPLAGNDEAFDVASMIG